jgi:branched-chain amino acid transport system substrate-binding protein
LVTVFLLLLATSPAHAEIYIAASGPITGQDATTGEQMQRGAQAAVDAINASGGVLGQKIRLRILDDACDPKQAVAIANQLSGINTFAIIGPMCSGAAIPASKVYNEEGIIMISPSATSPLMTENGLRPRRSARRYRRAFHRRQIQGQEHRHRAGQDGLRSGPRRSGEENPEFARYPRDDV